MLGQGRGQLTREQLLKLQAQNAQNTLDADNQNLQTYVDSIQGKTEIPGAGSPLTVPTQNQNPFTRFNVDPERKKEVDDLAREAFGVF